MHSTQPRRGLQPDKFVVLLDGIHAKRLMYDIRVCAAAHMVDRSHLLLLLLKKRDSLESAFKIIGFNPSQFESELLLADDHGVDLMWKFKDHRSRPAEQDSQLRRACKEYPGRWWTMMTYGRF